MIIEINGDERSLYDGKNKNLNFLSTLRIKLLFLLPVIVVKLHISSSDAELELYSLSELSPGI